MAVGLIEPICPKVKENYFLASFDKGKFLTCFLKLLLVYIIKCKINLKIPICSTLIPSSISLIVLK